MKIRVSYTPDEEATAARIVAWLRELLPPLKVKKSTTSPPYNHLYITTCKKEGQE